MTRDQRDAEGRAHAAKLRADMAKRKCCGSCSHYEPPAPGDAAGTCTKDDFGAYEPWHGWNCERWTKRAEG